MSLKGERGESRLVKSNPGEVMKKEN